MKKVGIFGNPNVGKSSLFNILTGSKQKVMNVPKTTVNYKVGKYKNIKLIDLPGVYSFNSVSEDERNAIDFILKKDLNFVIFVMSSDSIHPSLFLFFQLLNKLKIRIIPVITKTDIIKINIDDIAKGIGSKIFAINPRDNKGIDDLKKLIDEYINFTNITNNEEINNSNKKTTDKEIFENVAEILREEYKKPILNTKTDKFDKFLLNKFIGIPLFFIIIFLILQITTILIAPIQDFFLSSLTVNAGNLLEKISYIHSHPLISSFLIKGVLEGVGTVMSFLPLVAFIFLFIAILEDSGYLSRVAFLLNNLMEKIGLEGTAYLPLILGFGCNVPALESTKIINNQTKKRTVGSVIPYTLCSARLVVFLFISMIFFPKFTPLVVVLLYIISIFLIIFVSLIYKKSTIKNKGIFIIYLTPYQFPKFKNIFYNIFLECKSFLKNAGKIIVFLCMIVWLFMVVHIPFLHHSNNTTIGQNNSEIYSQNNLRVSKNIDENKAPQNNGGDYNKPIRKDSLFDDITQYSKIIFKPAGFGEQHFTAAILTGFIAKEAVVGTIATTFETSNNKLLNSDELNFEIKKTLSEVSGGHPKLSAFSFMLFILIYTPCAATVAQTSRIFGKRFAVKSALLSIVFAWLISTVFFQIFSRL